MQAERRQRAASSVRVTFTRFFIAIPVIGYEIKELLAPLRSVMMRRRRIRGRRQHAAAAEEAESRCQHQQLCQNFFHVFSFCVHEGNNNAADMPSAGTLKPTDGLPKQSIVRQRCWIFSAAVRHGWKKTGGGGGGGAGTTICGGGSGCGAGRITAGAGPGCGGG